MYRAAIVGCGPRSINHARAYAQIGRAELVACCSRRAEVRDPFAARFGLRAYADVAEMLEREKPDLVHLVTWPAGRASLMALVHQHNVPACIVEKPIAAQVADWRQLRALAAVTRTKFATCHQFRWHSALSAGREALRSGRLGRLLFLDCSARFNISGQGTHLLDYAMSLNADSPVTRVFGAASGGTQMDSPHPGPDNTVAQLDFANGVRALWSTGLASPQAIDDATPWKHVRIAAYAERGRTLYEEFGRWQIVSPDGIESGEAGDMQAWADGNLAAQAGLVNAMLDWIENDARPAGTHLKQSLHQWNVVLGLYASALWRRPVDIPFDVPDDLFAQLARAL